ncbi:hypothetical protein QQ045_019814 [Rhodiola kirilowii]
MMEGGELRGKRQLEFLVVSADIPLFHGTMGVEEFVDWQIDVDRFCEVMCVPENKQVNMVAIRLKGTAVVWWDKLVIQRRRQGDGEPEGGQIYQWIEEFDPGKDGVADCLVSSSGVQLSTDGRTD